MLRERFGLICDGKVPGLLEYYQQTITQLVKQATDLEPEIVSVTQEDHFAEAAQNFLDQDIIAVALCGVHMAKYEWEVSDHTRLCPSVAQCLNTTIRHSCQYYSKNFLLIGSTENERHTDFIEGFKGSISAFPLEMTDYSSLLIKMEIVEGTIEEKQLEIETCLLDLMGRYSDYNCRYIDSVIILDYCFTKIFPHPQIDSFTNSYGEDIMVFNAINAHCAQIAQFLIHSNHPD